MEPSVITTEDNGNDGEIYFYLSAFFFLFFFEPPADWLGLKLNPSRAAVPCWGQTNCSQFEWLVSKNGTGVLNGLITPTIGRLGLIRLVVRLRVIVVISVSHTVVTRNHLLEYTRQMW